MTDQQQTPRCPHGVPTTVYCQGCHHAWLAAQRPPQPVVVVQQGKKPTSTVGCIFGVILAPIVLIAVILLVGFFARLF